MKKFDIIPGKDPESGLIDVMHIESPHCHILISDLNINDAHKGDTECPVKIYDFVDAENDGHYYWVEIMILEMFESGDYNQVMEDCWKWWVAMQIKKRNTGNFSED
ncbi:hypothetical protein [Agriterribacter sp.]|uniref:hypothetical protein n=1 Tax=Agriterribacter sp. TaxID=2821509 RepID=UPI002B66A0AA|nr:hypothetical protein [Agriterribacter sp.]HRO46334.1 hypothetical protein [Agriterribacter sp.]HRQ17501.1 hypothetical protein [Agriterribacter sp.]